MKVIWFLDQPHLKSKAIPLDSDMQVKDPLVIINMIPI